MEDAVMHYYKEKESEFEECAAKLQLFQTVDRRTPQS
jgi:hypothetical protein